MTTPSPTGPLASRPSWPRSPCWRSPAPRRSSRNPRRGRARVHPHQRRRAGTDPRLSPGTPSSPESGGVYRPVSSAAAAAQEQGPLRERLPLRAGRVSTSAAVSASGRSWQSESACRAVASRSRQRIGASRTRSSSASIARSPARRRLWPAGNGPCIQVLVTVPATRSFTVSVFGGPTLFHVQQRAVRSWSWSSCRAARSRTGCVRGPVPAPSAVAISVRLADALATLHEAGFLHGGQAEQRRVHVERVAEAAGLRSGARDAPGGGGGVSPAAPGPRRRTRTPATPHPAQGSCSR